MSNAIYHKNDIIEIENFISKEDCINIIQYLNSEPSKWTVFNETFTQCYGMPLSFYDKNLDNYKLKRDIFEDIHFKFKNTIQSVFSKKFTGVTYHAQKWNTGGAVDPHSDISDLEGNLNTNSTNKFTVILYLNDDYQGGELYFTQHDIKIKPKAGSIVTFPGDHTNIHGVSEVLNNIRYTIVSWWDYDNTSIIDDQIFSNDTYINKKIHYYKNIVKSPQSIIDKLNSIGTEWQFYPTKVGNGQAYEKNSYEFEEYKKVDIENIGNEILECIKDYEIKNNIKLKRFTDPILTRAYPGKHSGPHTDSHGDSNSPYITIIITLNDKYNGGEIVFEKQNLTLKPDPGSVLIYPCVEPYSHIPTLITSGSKISCIIFGFKE